MEKWKHLTENIVKYNRSLFAVVSAGHAVAFPFVTLRVSHTSFRFSTNGDAVSIITVCLSFLVVRAVIKTVIKMKIMYSVFVHIQASVCRLKCTRAVRAGSWEPLPHVPAMGSKLQ